MACLAWPYSVRCSGRRKRRNCLVAHGLHKVFALSGISDRMPNSQTHTNTGRPAMPVQTLCPIALAESWHHAVRITAQRGTCCERYVAHRADLSALVPIAAAGHDVEPLIAAHCTAHGLDSRSHANIAECIALLAIETQDTAGL